MRARPEYPNDIRDLPPALAGVAGFVIVIGHEPIDGREARDKVVARCEGGLCVLPSREPPQ
jgi:hypothetical protein